MLSLYSRALHTTEKRTTYKVAVNHEQQYSISFADQENARLLDG